LSSAPPPERTLGVIECFTAVVRQCPKAAARAVAEGALEAVERDGGHVLHEHAYLVLSALRGWQGDRAAHVKRSLQTFLASGAP
jgi:hypothetical protein